MQREASMRRVLHALAAACLVACAAAEVRDGETTADEEIRTARKCEQDFGAPLRENVARARESLDRSSSRYAAEVRAALAEGRVRVAPFCAMAPEDFEHFRKDTDLSAFGATPEEQQRRLRAGETRGMRSVHAQLYGYMWEDRVYLASNLSASATLEVLAHEVRHVLRRAHERNFDDQRVTCVEELEAARAEVLVHTDELSPEQDRALLDRVHELYELHALAPGKCSY